MNADDGFSRGAATGFLDGASSLAVVGAFDTPCFFMSPDLLGFAAVFGVELFADPSGFFETPPDLK